MQKECQILDLDRFFQKSEMSNIRMNGLSQKWTEIKSKQQGFKGYKTDASEASGKLRLVLKYSLIWNRGEKWEWERSTDPLWLSACLGRLRCSGSALRCVSRQVDPVPPSWLKETHTTGHAGERNFRTYHWHWFHWFSHSMFSSHVIKYWFF